MAGIETVSLDLASYCTQRGQPKTMSRVTFPLILLSPASTCGCCKNCQAPSRPSSFRGSSWEEEGRLSCCAGTSLSMRLWRGLLQAIRCLQGWSRGYGETRWEALGGPGNGGRGDRHMSIQHETKSCSTRAQTSALPLSTPVLCLRRLPELSLKPLLSRTEAFKG